MKNWIMPRIDMEQFAANEFVAACDASDGIISETASCVGNTGSAINIYDPNTGGPMNFKGHYAVGVHGGVQPYDHDEMTAVVDPDDIGYGHLGPGGPYVYFWLCEPNNPNSKYVHHALATDVKFNHS